MSYCAFVFTVFQSHLQDLLGTIIDGQSSSRMTCTADWKKKERANYSNTSNNGPFSWRSIYQLGEARISLIQLQRSLCMWQSQIIPYRYKTVKLEVTWEGKSIVQFKQYDWAVRCSHTAPHFLIPTQHHTSVTVTELLPSDRTRLQCASVANSLPPVSRSPFT